MSQRKTKSTRSQCPPPRSAETAPSAQSQPSLTQPQPHPNLRRLLPRVYRKLLHAFGHQGWWPGDTPFEICVGAILTQNTNWKNVERAIQRLKKEKALEPSTLWQVPEETLAEWIRPAGYFRIKARRLRAFLKVLVEEYQGSLDLLFAGELDTVRQRLLAIPGIGPETADSMLLYAAERPTFVVDAYTRRIFLRHRWISEQQTDYETLRAICSQALWIQDEKARVELWKDAHAQFVRLGKDFCLARSPRCETCPLCSFLPTNPV